MKRRNYGVYTSETTGGSAKQTVIKVKYGKGRVKMKEEEEKRLKT
jgi:hypothetical protein